MTNWTIACYHKKDMVPIPTAAGSIVAALAGAKVVQRFGERNKDTKCVPPFPPIPPPPIIVTPKLEDIVPLQRLREISFYPVDKYKQL